MSKRNDSFLVGDILQSLQLIREYTAHLTFDEFVKSQITIDAVIRNFEICGEASNYISDDFKSAHSKIEWQKMVDFRNRLIHHYFGVNYEIVWEVINNEVPVYIKYLEK